MLSVPIFWRKGNCIKEIDELVDFLGQIFRCSIEIQSLTLLPSNFLEVANIPFGRPLWLYFLHLFILRSPFKEVDCKLFYLVMSRGFKSMVKVVQPRCVETYLNIVGKPISRLLEKLYSLHPISCDRCFTRQEFMNERLFETYGLKQVIHICATINYLILMVNWEV